MMADKDHMEQELPWWLEAGSEQCDHCLGWYTYESGCFCTECDGPVCPSCASYHRHEYKVVCPGCIEKEGDR